MKQPVPGLQTLTTKASEIKAAFASQTYDPNNLISATSTLWGTMLDLIYNGNLNAAWELCDLSWPKEYAGEKGFLKEFQKQLQQSAC